MITGILVAVVLFVLVLIGAIIALEHELEESRVMLTDSKEDARRLHAAMKTVEWAMNDYGEWECPYCGALEVNGHVGCCKLDAALRGTKK